MPETCRKKYPNDKVKRKACSRLKSKGNRQARVTGKAIKMQGTKNCSMVSFFKKTFNVQQEMLVTGY